MTADQNKFDSISFNVDSPEGNVTTIIVEDSPGKIHDIQVFVGKSGSGMNALVYALARMISFALESKDINDVLHELSSITSDKSRYTNKGVTVRSIPEAIYLALLRYRNMYPKVSDQGNVEFRPVKFANPNLAD